MKAAVVYFSLTGKTRTASQVIARVLGAEAFEVRERKARKGVRGLVSGGWQALTGAAVEIEFPEVNWEEYDRLVLAAPVWAMRPAPAIMSFIQGAPLAGKRVFLFVTTGAVGAEGALRRMRKLVEEKGATAVGSGWIATDRLTDEEIEEKARQVAGNCHF